MKRLQIMRALSAFGVGLLFGLGLIVSGMADPAKVLGFLDLSGAWDPSLALVMAGAIAVALPAFTALLRQAGFASTQHWTDERGWFAMVYARA